MYRTTKPVEGQAVRYQRPKTGEPLEMILARAQASGQPIQGGVTPLLYTLEDDENSRLATDIRTDKMTVATRMIDKWNNGKTKGKTPVEGEASEVARGEALEG